MSPKTQSYTGSDVIAPATLNLVCQPDRAEQSIQLYGWDLRSRTWHGPSELNLAGARPHRFTEALRKAPGPSWFGPMTCSAPGELTERFFVVAHDLRDCAVAMIYCGESKAGPVEIVAVMPAERRAQLRPEFAFEFLAFAGFLGSLGGDAELQVSEGIEAALGETGASDSLVFCISTGLWDDDLECVLSRCVEQTTISILRWLHKR
jgi:hypothetical protein